MTKRKDQLFVECLWNNYIQVKFTQQLTKDSNCGGSFCWSIFICHCTFVHWSIIFSCQLCQIKSLWCRQFAVVSLFGPCNVRVWIASGVTEQDGSIAFYNFITWWSWINGRGNCKTRTETQLDYYMELHIHAYIVAAVSNKNPPKKIFDVLSYMCNWIL